MKSIVMVSWVLKDSLMSRRLKLGKHYFHVYLHKRLALDSLRDLKKTTEPRGSSSQGHSMRITESKYGNEMLQNCIVPY